MGISVNKDKILEIGKLVLLFLLVITGIIFLVWGIRHFFKETTQEQTVDAAKSEFEQRIAKGKKLTLTDYQAKDLADKFFTCFNWKYAVTGASLSDVQPLIMQIKTYTDYLKVVDAYGVRSHAIYGHEGGLSYGAHDQPKGEVGVFFDAYVKALQKNNQ